MTRSLQEEPADTNGDHVAANGASESPALPDAVSPLIAQSICAFKRELPGLLKDHFGEWVAFQGDRCLGFGTSKTQLYQECFGKGLKRGEFLVECVEPEVERVTELFLNV